MKRPYWLNVLIADETISSHVGRTMHGKWQEKAIDWIFLHLTGEKNHCVNAVEKEFL
jgi:hypothetical protein